MGSKELKYNKEIYWARILHNIKVAYIIIKLK